MVGKQVSLSDERVGTVAAVDVKNPEFPVIEADGEVIHTDSNLYCVSLLYNEE